MAVRGFAYFSHKKSCKRGGESLNTPSGTKVIIGTGIDIVELDRIDAVYTKFGARFAKKILHPNELAQMPPNPRAYLGSRFAAKEAAVKALGTGFAYGVSPVQVEVAAAERGRPMLILHGEALARATHLGASQYHVSISHERHCTIAIVILEE